jgi:hypothetical protein
VRLFPAFAAFSLSAFVSLFPVTYPSAELQSGKGVMLPMSAQGPVFLHHPWTPSKEEIVDFSGGRVHVIYGPAVYHPTLSMPSRSKSSEVRFVHRKRHQILSVGPRYEGFNERTMPVRGRVIHVGTHTMDGRKHWSVDGQNWSMDGRNWPADGRNWPADGRRRDHGLGSSLTRDCADSMQHIWTGTKWEQRSFETCRRPRLSQYDPQEMARPNYSGPKIISVE